MKINVPIPPVIGKAEIFVLEISAIGPQYSPVSLSTRDSSYLISRSEERRVGKEC